jgi:periplasmic divalent cation tolerance protein
MKDSAYLILFITTSSSEEAHKIAEVLLNQRKAACVNIVPNVSSLFWWQEKIETAHENLLIVKTKAGQLGEIIKLVKELHSYDIPEIVALPIIGGNQDYLEWIGKEVQ